MANPLKFEIQIGSQLATQIKDYTTRLNELIEKFNNKTIKVGLDSNLTQILAELQQGFKNINQNQAEGLKNLKSITDYLQQQQKAMSGNADLSKQSADAANKEAEAYKKVAVEKERAANAGTGGNGNPKQLDWLKGLPTEDAIKNIFDAYLRQINTYSGQINDALKKMTEGVDVETMTGKFRQAVEGLIKVLEPMQNALTAVSKFGDDFDKAASKMAEATEKITNNLKDLNKVQKQSTAPTTTNAKTTAETVIRDVLEQKTRLETALHAIQIAQNKVHSAITYSGGNMPSEQVAMGNHYIAELERIATGIRNARQELQKSQQPIGNINEILNEQLRTLLRASSTFATAAQSANKFSAEEHRLAQAIGIATKEANSQSQVLSDLKSLMYQYFSVYGAQQFLTSMVQITGELELQRKSLEVILGSGTAASEMYTQLRDLSQQSPYTFEDLLKAHRQLAAFGIEAKNIYGTMKSLTDIGAGLDVPVERLILAYGHTKSYGYLSGIQNRQFETAGIDLVGALSDLYNRRADAAKAKGQTANYRSRKDIFALMRKREIPFEDVEEVIMDLDKPGGKFYNMQERQYNTLGGKLRNLRNNYRIMMSEMGGSQRGLLMGVVDTINNVTEHWDKYAKILLSVATAYGVLKASQMTVGRNMLAQNAAISATANRYVTDAKAANYLRTMDYGHWINGRQNLRGINPLATQNTDKVANLSRWASVRELAQNKELTNIQKQRIALTARLDKAQRAYLLNAAGVEKAQAMYISRFGAIRRGLISVRLGFIQATAAARVFMASLASQLAIMAPIMAITELVGRTMEQTRKANALAKDFREQSETNRKSVEEILNNYASRGLIDLNQGTKYDASGMRLDANNIIFNKDAFKGIDLSSDIEELKKKLQVLSPIYDGDLLDINKFETQEQQFEALIKKMESIRRANQVQESIASDLANADKRVAGNYAVTRAFGDTFTEDMQDYVQSYRNMRNDLQKEFTDLNSTLYTSDSNIEKIDQVTGGALTALKDGYGLSDYREALAVYFRKIAQMSEQERDKALGRLQGVTLANGSSARDLYESVANPWFGKNLDTQYRQMVDDAKEWSKSLGNDIISQFAGDPESAVAALMNSVNTFTATVTDPSLKQEIIDSIIQSLNDKYNGFTISGDYGDQNLQNEALGSLYAEALAKQQFAQYLKGLNGNMADNEGEKVFAKAFAKMQSYIRQHNYKFTALGKDAGYKWFHGLYEGAFNSLKANAAWQQRALNTIKTDQELRINIKSAVDIYAFAEDVQKKIKEARDKVEKMIPHIKALQVRLGINFNLSTQTSAEQINKQIQAMQAKVAIMKDGPAKKLYEELIKQYQDFATEAKSLNELTDWNKKEGFKDEDEEKRQKKREAAERKREAAQRAAEKARQDADNKDIKRFNDRIKALQNARKMYEDWYNRYNDKDYAIAQVRERMTNALKQGDYVKGSINEEDYKNLDSFTDLRDLYGKLQQIVSKWQPRTENGKERKKDLLSSIESARNDLDVREADKQLKKFSDAIKRATEQLSDAYESFRTIRDKTGDADFAMQLSKFSIIRPELTQGRGWNEQVRSLYGLVATKLQELSLPMFGDTDMSRLYNLTGDNLKSEVSKLLRGGLSKREGESDGDFKKHRDDMLNHTDAIVSIVEQFNTAMRNLVKSAQSTAAELYASSNTYKLRRQKELDTYTQNGKAVKAVGPDNKPLFDEATQAMLNRRNNLLHNVNDPNSLAALNMRGDINRMLNAPTTMHLEQVRKLGQGYINAYSDAFVDGMISEDERNNAVTKAQTAMRTALSAAGNNLVGQMSFMGGMFFDPTKHTQDLQNARNSYTMQLAEQQSKPLSDQDLNFINLLKEVVQALDSVLSGAGGRGAVRDAAWGMKNVNDWENKTPEQQQQTGDKAKKKYDAGTGDPFGLWDKASETLDNAMGKFVAALNAGAQAVNLISDTFDKLGLGDTAFGSAMSDAGDLMSGMASGAQAGAAFGPWGMAAGAGLGLLGSLGSLHDKHQQKKIDKLQEDVSKIEGYTETISKAQERTLGYSYRGSSSVISGYQKQYSDTLSTIKTVFGNFTFSTEGAAGKAMADYYNTAGNSKDLSVYQQQYNMLIAKRKDYIDMYNAENSKKKKSNSALQEYKDQIASLDDEIRYFAEDLANTLYGIDFKSWADQLGDALITAFENGEDAADAFDDSVTSILQSLVKKMIATGILEPKFEQLRKNLFGENGEGGSFDISDPNGTKNAWMKDINEALGDDGYIREGLEASETLFNEMETLANKYGNTLLNSNSATMSSSIKGITEQTADLLAAYLNAIRADVSVIRQIFGSKSVTFMDTMSQLAHAQVQYQSQIASNTLRNAQAAEMIYQSTNELVVIFRSVTNDTKRLNVTAH